MTNLYKQPSTYIALPAGFLFGANLQRSQMSNPDNIRSQMVMKQPNRMLKTFLSASASSALAFSLIDLFDGPLISRTVGYNPLRQVVGGLVLGIGMNFGGACPGTVFAQLGSALAEKDKKALRNALITFLGGFAASAVVSSNQSFIEKNLGTFGNTWTLLDATGVKSYWKLGIPFALALFGVVLGVTYIESVLNSTNTNNKSLNNEEDSKIHEPSTEVKNKQSLQATVVGITSGLMLGLVQLPFYYIGKSYIGTSTFYVSVIEPLVKNPYTQLRTFSKNAFQVLSNIGIVLGSYFIASQNPSTDKSSDKTEKKESVESNKCNGFNLGCIFNKFLRPFLSGFFLITGARIMEGCTSGHGLSGMAMLSIPSFIAVGSMFAGGMASAQVERFLQKQCSSK